MKIGGIVLQRSGVPLRRNRTTPQIPFLPTSRLEADLRSEDTEHSVIILIGRNLCLFL